LAVQEPLSRLRIEDLTTSNDAMARCLQLAGLAAKSEVPVVLLGETGTGKTLLAHAIHNSSARAGRRLLLLTPRRSATRYSRVSCSAMSAALLPARNKALKANSNWPMAARFSWMRSRE